MGFQWMLHQVDVASLAGVLGHMISHILQVQSKQSTSICTVYYRTNKSMKEVFRVVVYIHHFLLIFEENCLFPSVFSASFCLNLKDHHLLLWRAQILVLNGLHLSSWEKKT
jgi:hypothetical protein